MSKSLGNVINPFELINKYGVDAVRYYLLREIPPTDDGDYSENRMKELYNSDLANELGNLVSRVTNLCEQNNIEFNSLTKEIPFNSDQGGFAIHLEKFEFNLALEELWRDIKKINYEINLDRSWSMEGPADFLKHYLKEIQKLHALQPFLPETSEKILKATQGKNQKNITFISTTN